MENNNISLEDAAGWDQVKRMKDKLQLIKQWKEQDIKPQNLVSAGIQVHSMSCPNFMQTGDLGVEINLYEIYKPIYCNCYKDALIGKKFW